MIRLIDFMSLSLLRMKMRMAVGRLGGKEEL